MPAFSRFDKLLCLRWPHESSSRGEVEAGGRGTVRSKRKGPPRVEKRAAKRGERSDFHPFINDKILDLLHIFMIEYQAPGTAVIFVLRKAIAQMIPVLDFLTFVFLRQRAPLAPIWPLRAPT